MAEPAVDTAFGPETMTVAERRAEVASILVVGLVRAVRLARVGPSPPVERVSQAGSRGLDGSCSCGYIFRPLFVATATSGAVGSSSLRRVAVRRIAVLSSLAVLAAPANADPAPNNKSQYSLLNPTPRELRRPMSPDRPDVTESPFTVDAGAVQLELSFIDYGKNGQEKAFTVAPATLKLGLLNNVDLQFVFAPYIHQDDGAQTRDGIGDAQFRLKVNLWGNDGGQAAFAIMPFIKAPAASDSLGDGHVEGGLIFPFATELGEGVELGLMFETDFVYDRAGARYDTEFITTGVLGFDITDELGLYVEGIGITSTDPDVDFRGVLGVGATYKLTENMILDAGVNIGLTGDADDVNLFSGISVRF